MHSGQQETSGKHLPYSHSNTQNPVDPYWRLQTISYQQITYLSTCFFVGVAADTYARLGLAYGFSRIPTDPPISAPTQASGFSSVFSAQSVE
jgi:hypothetical protein